MSQQIELFFVEIKWVTLFCTPFYLNKVFGGVLFVKSIENYKVLL